MYISCFMLRWTQVGKEKWLFKQSVFGCNINSFSLTEGCPLSLWMTAVQNSPKFLMLWTIFLQCINQINILGEYFGQGSFAPPKTQQSRPWSEDHFAGWPSQGGGGGGGGYGSGAFLWTKSINESSLRCMDNEVLSMRSSEVSLSESDKPSIGHKVRPLFYATSILTTFE